MDFGEAKANVCFQLSNQHWKRPSDVMEELGQWPTRALGDSDRQSDPAIVSATFHESLDLLEGCYMRVDDLLHGFRHCGLLQRKSRRALHRRLLVATAGSISGAIAIYHYYPAG